MFALPSRALSLLALGYTVAAAYNYSTVTEHCEDLWGFTGDAGLEAPTKVTNVTYVSANEQHPAFCSVTAFVLGNTGILVYLPAEGSDWKGVFSSHGCGGSCGAMGLEYQYGYGSGPFGFDLLQRGYVTSMTDMGHQNGPNDSLSLWEPFRNNRTVEINWAYLSTHLLTVSGKALTEFYYEKPIQHSYWRGGSTGGRQGLMIAQRYPHDFDALIVAYAASNETGIGGLQYPYVALASKYDNGSIVMSIDDIKALHKGAVNACDANDGLVDGIIDNSYKCDFDPVSILCSANKTTDCLANMDKVNAARKFYSYPSNSRTDRLINHRFVPGSELQWAGWTSKQGVVNSESFLRNAAFQQDLPEDWPLDDYDFDVHPYILGPMEDIYGASNADLSVFRGKGGKIIHYTGTADGSVTPTWGAEYYNKVVNQMGGLEEVQSFYRFFTIPGMAHLDVGDNSTVAFRCSYYDYLEQWYLEDKAPESLLVTRFNYTSNNVIDYRPHFPWPLVAKWTGEGKPTGTMDDVQFWKAVEVPENQRGDMLLAV